MNKNSKKRKNLIPPPGTLVLLAFIPLSLVYMELMLRLLADGDIRLGFPASMLFPLAAGFLISLITALIGKHMPSRIAGSVLLGAAGVVFTVQQFMYQSFKAFMTFETIFIEARNALGGFTETIFGAIARGVPLILAFLTPCILFLIFTSKKLFPHTAAALTNPRKTPPSTSPTAAALTNPRKTPPSSPPRHLPAVNTARTRQTRVTVLLSLAAFILTLGGQALALHANDSDRAAFYSEYNFDATARRLGILPGVCLDIWYGIAGSPLESAAFMSVGDMDALMQLPDITPPDIALPPIGSSEHKAGRTVAANTRRALVSQDADSPNPDAGPEPAVYAHNIIDIDFDMLKTITRDTRIIEMHDYVSGLAPTSQNRYTGIFEGKNLIIICAEAFTKQAVDSVMTPVLYRLVSNGFYFSDFFQPGWGGGTAGGEFAILTGFPPTMSSASTLIAAGHNTSYTIGNKLMNLGYHSAAYHNGSYTYYNRNETHTHMGYETFQAFGGGMTGRFGSDLAMMEFSVPQYIDNRPFSVYYMTVSAHAPYNEGNAMAAKYWDAFPEQYSQMPGQIRAYMAANQELEHALAYLVGRLEEEGIADDTVIVLATDHFPYGLSRSGTWESGSDYLALLLGVENVTIAERDANALILWSGSLENKHKDLAVEISTPVSTLDILPTLLNLFGLEYDSRLFVGRDVFSDAFPLVFWLDRSWKTEAGFYYASRGQFVPAMENLELPDGYIDAVKSIVSNKISYSRSVLSRDYFGSIFRTDGTLRTAQERWEPPPLPSLTPPPTDMPPSQEFPSQLLPPDEAPPEPPP